MFWKNLVLMHANCKPCTTLLVTCITISRFYLYYSSLCNLSVSSNKRRILALAFSVYINSLDNIKPFIKIIFILQSLSTTSLKYDITLVIFLSFIKYHDIEFQ